MTLKTVASVCRSCLKETLDSYIEMKSQCYFSVNDENFVDIFNLCTHLKIQIGDEFPQRICLGCAQDLKKTYEFLKIVWASNRKLLELKGHFNRNNEILIGDNVPIKDPLENATDEDTLYSANIWETLEQSRTSLDNADNTIEDSKVNATLLNTPFQNESDDGDGNFFNSMESQIFPQGRLKCSICHKAYFTNVGLQAHMGIHIPKRTVFQNAGKYTKKKKFSVVSKDQNINDPNVQLTTGESKTKPCKPKKTFPCEVCGKHMISASKLRYHMVMHTGQKDYLCTMCPKAYSTIYALKHHLRTHTGERPYECRFCGDRFLRPTTLKSHMRRHTGERPYGCDICGKRFIQHSSMATHMKLNHMDKTIPCNYCDKKYARQTDLNTHILSHSGDKPFACQICPSRFTRQSNLNKHMNQQHSNIDIKQ